MTDVGRSRQEGDRSLVRRFRDGDPAATERVQLRIARIIGFRGYGIRREDRSEIEQTALLQAWQACSKRPLDEDSFWGLVEVICSRRCIDWHRTYKASGALEEARSLADPAADPLGRALRRERTTLVESALAELSPPCRELIELHYRDQLSYRELAARLAKSEGALRVQMHRCVQRAARILREVVDARGPRDPRSDL